MTLYTFYPCRADGTSDTFVCFDLADDTDAYVRALHVLDQHPTSSHVVVWAGERKVLTRAQVHPDLRATLSTSAPSTDTSKQPR